MNALICHESYAQAYAMYEWLKDTVLAHNGNQAELKKRVEETYFELLDDKTSEYNFYWHNALSLSALPSSSEVAEVIYMRDMDYIANSMIQAGFNDDEIDHIIAIYCHEIGSTLDDIVGQALWEFGFPTKDSENSFVVVNLNSRDIEQRHIDYGDYVWI